MCVLRLGLFDFPQVMVASQQLKQFCCWKFQLNLQTLITSTTINKPQSLPDSRRRDANIFFQPSDGEKYQSDIERRAWSPTEEVGANVGQCNLFHDN